MNKSSRTTSFFKNIIKATSITRISMYVAWITWVFYDRKSNNRINNEGSIASV